MASESTGHRGEPYAVGDLQVTPHGDVTVVAMNRPDKLNAMGAGFWANLREMLARLEGDGRTRAVVITGAGDKAFSVGGDIESFMALETLAAKRDYQIDAMRAFAAVEESQLPVIAAVNGWALGGGCELTMACDFVIAAEKAVFGMPEAGLGLVPGFGVLRGPSVIGRQMTKLMVMASERLGAREALAAGLVQRVVADDALMEAALALAGKVAANSAFALAVGKQLINRGIDRGEFSYSVEAITLLHGTDDTAEGVRAFLEKRKPRFGPRSG